MTLREKLREVVRRTWPFQERTSRAARLEAERELAQVFRDSASHEAAMLLSTFVAGARGSSDPDRQRLAAHFADVVARVDAEQKELAELALRL